MPNISDQGDFKSTDGKLGEFAGHFLISIQLAFEVKSFLFPVIIVVKTRYPVFSGRSNNALFSLIFPFLPSIKNHLEPDVDVLSSILDQTNLV